LALLAELPKFAVARIEFYGFCIDIKEISQEKFPLLERPTALAA
jgi:hypothetical protein